MSTPDTTTTVEKLLDVSQLCEAWGVKPGWVYDQVEAAVKAQKAGDAGPHLLPFTRLGRHVRFRPSDLAAYLSEHTVKVAA